jgi:hypothetical protein
MNPDHPMLRRAQQVLARQLNAKRMRVEGELREKQTALQVRLVSLLLYCCSSPVTMQQHAASQAPHVQLRTLAQDDSIQSHNSSGGLLPAQI